MPQLSRKVAGETGQLVQKTLAKEIISIRPRRITAALVLSPNPRPSQKPAPTATMFCSDDEVIYMNVKNLYCVDIDGSGLFFKQTLSFVYSKYTDSFRFSSAALDAYAQCYLDR